MFGGRNGSLCLFQGIKDIRNIILSALMDVNTFAPYTMTKQYENVYHAICNLRNNGTLMVHWRELKDVIKNAGIAKDPERIKIVKLLSDLVCIFSFHDWMVTYFPVDIYLLKVTNKITRTMCEICLKLAIKTPEWRLCFLYG